MDIRSKKYVLVELNNKQLILIMLLKFLMMLMKKRNGYLHSITSSNKKYLLGIKGPEMGVSNG